VNPPFISPRYDAGMLVTSRTAPPVPDIRPSRRRVVLGGLGLIALAGAASTAYAGAEALGLVVTRYRLQPPAWPLGRRLTITVIADLHAGGPNMGLGRVDEVVAVANLLKSDLIVLLGDYFATHRFVTEVVPPGAWSAALARLRAPLGVWSILGNHDWWYDIGGTRKALDAVGIPVLENDARLLGEAPHRFWLAGLGDQLAYRLGHGRFRGIDDLPGTLARAGSDDPVILLVHEPDIFTEVPGRVALTLAGHTHGGQINLPFVGPPYVPSMYGTRFAYGHVVEQGRHMVVSGGLGMSWVPARFGVPPEIVHITLG
jgi:predicted MPP superfamily phosphohydrolase